MITNHYTWVNWSKKQTNKNNNNKKKTHPNLGFRSRFRTSAKFITIFEFLGDIICLTILCH